MDERAEVVVVGAGPAGSAAAITLARAGRAVVLLDRAAFPRDKPCGDLIGARGLRLARRLGVEDGAFAPYAPLAGVLVTCGDERLDLTPTSPAGRALLGGADARVIPRATFDAALVRSAVRLGVALRRLSVQHVSPPSDTGRYVTGTGPGGPVSIHTRAVVVAGGYGCRVAGDQAQPASERAGARAVGMRGYFRSVSAPPGRMLICVEKGPAPGYGWLFPLPDGGANVGVGMLIRDEARGAEARRFYADFTESATSPIARWLRDATPAGAPRAWPLDLGPSRGPLAADGLLVSGEAAALVGPLTGAGISFALESGVLAGRTLATALAHNNVGRAALRPYEVSIRRRIGRGLRLEAAAQRWLSDPPHLRGLMRTVRPLPVTAAIGARLLLNLG